MRESLMKLFQQTEKLCFFVAKNKVEKKLKFTDFAVENL